MALRPAHGACTSLGAKLLEEVHDLVDDLYVALLYLLDHASLEMLLEQQARDCLDGAFGGGELVRTSLQ